MFRTLRGRIEIDATLLARSQRSLAMPARFVFSVACVLLIADPVDSAKVRSSGPSYALSLAAAKAGQEGISVDPLAGIPAVFVSKCRLSPRAARNTGLSRAGIEGLIEQELREHRVPLRPVDEGQRDKPPKYAMLSVEVRVVQHGNLSAYDVTLALLETLQRQHDRDIFVHAPIWRCQELGVIKTSDLKGEIVDAVRAAVADFSSAFAAAH